MFACDSTRYNSNNNNNKTKRYINSSVRHFDNVFAQILLECEGGDSAQSKNRGPRLSSPLLLLLFTSRLFYTEKGHCETKPKTERSITNSSHLGLGLFRLSFVSVSLCPSSSPSLPLSLSTVFRLSCVSFSLYLRLSLCAVFLTCHAYFSPAQQ